MEIITGMGVSAGIIGALDISRGPICSLYNPPAFVIGTPKFQDW